MSIKGKFFLSSILMLILLLVVMGLISALILLFFLNSFPAMLLEIKDIHDVFSSPDILRAVTVWIIILIIVVAACCIGVTAYLSHSILSPLKKISEAMEHLTDGDLDYEFSCSGEGEVKELYNSIERLRLRLKKSVSDEIARTEQNKMLIANISHDLKTPITSIKGYVEGIRDGIAASPEMMDKYLDTILIKANTLERMVSNLSLYSELDFGRIRYRVLDITEFIGQMLNEYALDFKKAGIETETDIPKESIYMNADSDKLKRVFSNIFDNTVKYRKSGMAGRLKVSIAQEDDFAVLAFSDNGIGMDAGDEKRAFETFFRADPARSMNVSGNGLGLSICDKIIKEHGGRIWIRSGGEGGGVTVYVRLAVLK